MPPNPKCAKSNRNSNEVRRIDPSSTRWSRKATSGTLVRQCTSICKEIYENGVQPEWSSQNSNDSKAGGESTTCMLVGYAQDHSGDCYEMVNLTKNGILQTRGRPMATGDCTTMTKRLTMTISFWKRQTMKHNKKKLMSNRT